MTAQSKQALEVSRRQARVRESPTPENVAKLHAAEAKKQELKANMAVLGKEASAALAAVDAQQQRLTFQRLVSMVCGEFLGYKFLCITIFQCDIYELVCFLRLKEKRLII